MKNNIKAFELMILSSTLLGNDCSDKWEEDAQLVLKFLGRVFALDQKVISETIEKIIRAAKTIQTEEDASITFLEELEQFEVLEIEYLKGKIIIFLQSLVDYNLLYFTDYRYVNPYFPEMHFHNTSTLAKEGYLIAIRHLALLYLLGIGTKVEKKRAEKLLWNCAYWGDGHSLYILRELAKENGKTDLYQNLSDLILLFETSLYEGATEIADSANYNVWVQERYKLISSIYHDIILVHFDTARSKHTINASFVEVMQLPDLSYAKKMAYINKYLEGEWKNETNKIVDSGPSIGFVKGDKK